MSKPKRTGWGLARALAAGTASALVALTLGFAALFFTQWQQWGTLSSLSQTRADYLPWTFFQLQAEALRLSEALATTQASDRASVDRLVLRYEIFVSRIDLVRSSRNLDGLRGLTDLDPTVQALDRFVADTDARLPRPDTAEVATPPTLTPAEIERVRDSLTPLLARLQRLSVQAQTGYSDKVTERSMALRDVSAGAIGLTVLQMALVCALVLLAAVQFRALNQRRARQLDLLKRLRVARHRAQAASSAKSRFVANMSHEIRTPFQAILGQLALLEAQPLSPAQVEHLALAVESAQGLLVLLNDVLDVSAMEAGSFRLAPEPCDVVELLQDQVRLLTPPAQAKGLALSLRACGAPPVALMVDPARLRQIMTNLLSNALKFTPSGRIDVKVRFEPVADDPSQCCVNLMVRDTGIGLSEQSLARLFERFYQADTRTHRTQTGAGLGLEISRSIARQMGGELSARSEPGQGSEFDLRLCLPVAPQPNRAGRCGAAEGAAPGDTPTPTTPLKLLVAEDNALVRRYLQSVLAALGHTAVLVDDGIQAIDQAARERFDAIVLDVHMPLMDGIAAGQAIRALPGALGRVPLMALTADVMRDTRARLLAAGFDLILDKPIRRGDLAQGLQRLGAVRLAPPEAAA